MLNPCKNWHSRGIFRCHFANAKSSAIYSKFCTHNFALSIRRRFIPRETHSWMHTIILVTTGKVNCDPAKSDNGAEAHARSLARASLLRTKNVARGGGGGARAEQSFFALNEKADVTGEGRRSGTSKCTFRHATSQRANKIITRTSPLMRWLLLFLQQQSLSAQGFRRFIPRQMQYLTISSIHRSYAP